ncbi:MAG: hypothetical protein WA373_09340 [Burkholderiales bacterium]
MSSQRAGFDHAEAARVFAEVAQRSSRLLADFARHHADGKGIAFSDEFGIARAFMELAANMLANPWKLAETQMKMFWDYTALWQSTLLRMMGHEAKPVAESAEGDNRFRHEDWENHFLFDYLKQSYLIMSRHVHDAVSSAEGLPEETQKKVNFFTRQYIDALSPSNFAHTNPQVLRETLASGGQNLLRGLNNLLADIERGDGQLRISMTDDKAFKVGVNVATAPGKVVFQNDLMQLIQYAPSTAAVFRRPLLIVPPWINKYYILDLREKNSFIRWAVGEGHTVFVISWINPDAAHAGKSFEDYMFEGPLAALDAIGKATGERSINVIGYCLGGTLLGATLAWMAGKSDRRAVSKGRGGQEVASQVYGGQKAASATFFVSLLDFPFRASWAYSSTSSRSETSSGAWASAAISTAPRWRPPSTCCARTT